MGKCWRIVGALVLVLGAGGLGYSQYMSHEQRGRTTDLAADAISAVASAASRMTVDSTIYTIVVSTRVGQGHVGDRDIPMSVQATISLRGSSALSDMCVSLPRVRDTVNAALTDHLVPKLRSGLPILPDQLVADGTKIRDSLNRLVQGEAVSAVRLLVKPAMDAQDSGCSDRTRTANVGGPPRE
jgi:hypothetical protein